MRTMPLVISPWSNTARHKGFYEGPSRCEWPFRAIYYHPIRHNERNFAMVVAGVVVVPLVASVVKRMLWGGSAAIDQ